MGHAYAQCRSNKGAPGVDGQDFADIEAYRLGRWTKSFEALLAGTGPKTLTLIHVFEELRRVVSEVVIRRLGLTASACPSQECR